MAQRSVNVNVRVHSHRHVGCLGALFLSPYYAVKFMVLALAAVLWIYGTIFWYMGCAAVLAVRALALAWRSYQAGTLWTPPAVSARGNWPPVIPGPALERGASRHRIAQPL